MEPNNTQQYVSNVPVKTKSTGKTIAIVLQFIIIGILVGGCVYLYSELQNSKRAEADTKTQLEQNEQKLKIARDLQRKKDILLLKNVINDYKDDKGSYYTTEGTQSRVIYETKLSPLIDDFTDPTSGERYGYEAIAAVHTPSPLELGVIQYQWLGKCTADGDFKDTTSESFAAIRTVLESGETYCVDL